MSPLLVWYSVVKLPLMDPSSGVSYAGGETAELFQLVTSDILISWNEDELAFESRQNIRWLSTSLRSQPWRRRGGADPLVCAGRPRPASRSGGRGLRPGGGAGPPPRRSAKRQ